MFNTDGQLEVRLS